MNRPSIAIDMPAMSWDDIERNLPRDTYNPVVIRLNNPDLTSKDASNTFIGSARQPAMKREVIIRYQFTKERISFYGMDLKEMSWFDPYDSGMFIPLQFHITSDNCDMHGKSDCDSWYEQKVIKSPHFDMRIPDMQAGDGFSYYFCPGTTDAQKKQLFEAVQLEVKELYDQSSIYAHETDEEKLLAEYDPNDDAVVIFLDETPQ